MQLRRLKSEEEFRSLPVGTVLYFRGTDIIKLGKHQANWRGEYREDSFQTTSRTWDYYSTFRNYFIEEEEAYDYIG